MPLPNRAALRTRFIPHPLGDGMPIEVSPFCVTDRPIDALDLHDVLEIGLCLDGSGTYVVEDKVMAFRPGSVVVLNDIEYHQSRSEPGGTSRWLALFVRPAALIGGFDPDRRVLSTAELCGPEFPNVVPAGHDDLADLVRALADELANQRSGRDAAAKGLVWTIMARLHRLPGTTPVAAACAASLTRIAPALEQVKTRFVEPLTVEELASVCGVAVRTFSRDFQAATGESCLRFINRYRIELACRRLRDTDDSVLDISLDVGFASLTAFNKHFRAFTGRTPRDWRRGL